MADDRLARIVERVHETDIPVIYANSIELGFSLYDVMLVLGQTIRQDKETSVVNQVARVMLSPQHAKVIARILAEKLAEYEQRFGPIPADPNAEIVETAEI
jgi:hypothetical protein